MAKIAFLSNFANKPNTRYLQVSRPEGVRRNALRVLRPKSLHSEEIAQYIE